MKKTAAKEISQHVEFIYNEASSLVVLKHDIFSPWAQGAADGKDWKDGLSLEASFEEVKERAKSTVLAMNVQDVHQKWSDLKDAVEKVNSKYI
eukprot:8839209-Pyramimonas_sp.AAC.1